MIHVAGRAADTFTSLRHHPSHSHSISDYVGYTVRRTKINGVVLENKDGSVGHDVAVFSGANRYAEALALAAMYRTRDYHNYAVIDCLYGCGCRS